MLRCQEFEVNHYYFTLGRLDDEGLRLVQNSGVSFNFSKASDSVVSRSVVPMQE